MLIPGGDSTWGNVLISPQTDLSNNMDLAYLHYNCFIMKWWFASPPKYLPNSYHPHIYTVGLSMATFHTVTWPELH